MTPEKHNLAPLKTLVFSMGIILIAGTILLTALVWKKISADIATAHCPGGHADLSGRGAPSATVINGQTMYVTFKKPGGSETVMVDVCSGKISGSLMVDVDGGRTKSK